MTWLESGVLARRSLAVVLITDGDPADALRLVHASDVWNASPLASQLVLDLVHFVVLSIGGADEHVVGDVVQVTAILQPRAGGGDVIGCALSFDLDQDGHLVQVLAVPFLERIQELQAVGCRADVNAHFRAVLKEENRN